MEELKRKNSSSSYFISMGVENDFEEKPNIIELYEKMDFQDVTKYLKTEISNEDLDVKSIKIEPVELVEEQLMSCDFPIKTENLNDEKTTLSSSTQLGQKIKVKFGKKSLFY